MRVKFKGGEFGTVDPYLNLRVDVGERALARLRDKRARGAWRSSGTPHLYRPAIDRNEVQCESMAFTWF
jgi:hypothetical protein